MRFRNIHRGSLFNHLVSLAFILSALIGITACTPNTSSNSGNQTGPGGNGSFETNWKVSVVPAQSSLQQSVAGGTAAATLSTTSVVITITDSSGKPAPSGTTVLLTCGNGAFGFRQIATGYDYSQPITTDTRQLTNGKAFTDFIAGFTPGTATINATFQGVTATATITILAVP